MKIKLNIYQREVHCNKCPSQRLETDWVEIEHLCLSCDNVLISVCEDTQLSNSKLNYPVLNKKKTKNKKVKLSKLGALAKEQLW